MGSWAQVGVDLGEGLQLLWSQRERQTSSRSGWRSAADAVSAGAAGPAGAHGPCAAGARPASEGAPRAPGAPCLASLVRRARLMYGRHGVGLTGQPFADAQARRQRVGQPAAQRQHAVQQRAQETRGDLSLAG